MRGRSAVIADWIAAALIALAVGAIAGHESYPAHNENAAHASRGIQPKWNA